MPEQTTDAAFPCPVCGAVPMRPRGRADARYGLWSCDACSFACTLPRPTQAQLEAFYNEQEDYNRTPPPLTPAVAARRAADWDHRLRRAHPAARRVLEIGCQRGDLLFGLAGRGYAVAGADVCDTARHFASRHYGLAVHAGTLPPEVEQGRYDAVILSHVIEHVLSPVAMLTDVARFLAPGGVVLIETPGLDTVLFDLFGSRYNMVRPPEHISFLTRRAMPTLFARCGLETVAAETFTRSWSQPNPFLYGLLSLARSLGALDWLRRRRNPTAAGASTASMRLDKGGLAARALPVIDWTSRLATLVSWPLWRVADAGGKGLLLFAIGRKRA